MEERDALELALNGVLNRLHTVTQRNKQSSVLAEPRMGQFQS